MSYRLPFSKNLEKNASSGKKWFLYCVLPLFGLVFLSSFIFLPPDFEECKKGELGPRCVCPKDSQYIGKKNIILVDVTDKLPKGKAEDLSRLIQETALPEYSFFDWIASGKKVEKTSIYLLSDQKPSEMIPIASYCSFPPSIIWFLRESGDQEKKIKDGVLRDIKRVVDKVAANQGVGRSHIVEALSTITSNSSNWMPGSKLILFSDLYENSSTCGYFESGAIANFNSISPACKRWVNRLGSNLIGQSSGTQKNSTIAVCQILKPQKEGLIAFWRELFQSELGYDVIFSCDSQEIADRQKALNR